ncbi:hypothetical protein [Bdellovibrio bacteriovorus]|uniref:hypothetical protein n=1 Tax=Bdellovibrio bacteriovorus TaxID=959 RepID=UPI003AA96636
MKQSRYLITSHTAGATVDKRLRKALESFADILSAEIIVLRNKGPHQNAEFDLTLEDYFISRSKQLNSNLTVIADMNAVIAAENPTTQYKAEAGKTHSLIIPSPRRFQQSIPRADGLPRYITTSLSIDNSDGYPDTKNGRKSKALHQKGVCLVELKDDSIYFTHQLEAEKDGSIIFNGLQFCPSGFIKKVQAEAISFGDSHLDHIDPSAEKAALEICRLMNPRYVTEEDAFNGSSINHHEENNHLNSMNWMSLEEEAKFTAKKLAEHVSFLKLNCPSFKKLILKDSNHHDFLDRYISNFSRWMGDSKNKSLALRLAVDADDGRHLLESLLRRYESLRDVTFLAVGERFEVSGVEMSFHGHNGANGSKGSSKQFQLALTKANIGHTHVPEIFDSVFNAGTLSILRPAYAARGLTSWCHAVVVTYPSGSRQLLKIIDGDYTLEFSRSIKSRILRLIR